MRFFRFGRLVVRSSSFINPLVIISFRVLIEFVEDVDYLMSLDVLGLRLRGRQQSRSDSKHCFWDPVIGISVDDLLLRPAILLCELHVRDINHFNRVLPHQAILTLLLGHCIKCFILDSCGIVVIQNIINASVKSKLLRIFILQSIIIIPPFWMLKLRNFDKDIPRTFVLIIVDFDLGS